jgi:hypothetical protein
LNDQILEDDLRARGDDLEHAILELAGVNDRGIVPARPGPLEDPAAAGLGQIQVAGEARRFVLAADIADRQRIGACLELEEATGLALLRKLSV